MLAWVPLDLQVALYWPTPLAYQSDPKCPGPLFLPELPCGFARLRQETWMQDVQDPWGVSSRSDMTGFQDNQPTQQESQLEE